MKTPDPHEIRELVHYEPSTGEMTWKARNNPKWDAKWAGKPAFNSLDHYGYRQGQILGKMLKGHRVAWAIAFGSWPKKAIDHINGDRADNRISNLREATESENRRNMRPRRIGVALGVHRQGKNTWRATIGINGKAHHIGSYGTYEAAVAARKHAERKFGFHPNHGCDVTDLRREGEAA